MRWQVVHPPVTDVDLARCDVLEPHDHAQDGRLPTPGRPDQIMNSPSSMSRFTSLTAACRLRRSSSRGRGGCWPWSLRSALHRAGGEAGDDPALAAYGPERATTGSSFHMAVSIGPPSTSRVRSRAWLRRRNEGSGRELGGASPAGPGHGHLLTVLDESSWRITWTWDWNGQPRDHGVPPGSAARSS